MLKTALAISALVSVGLAGETKIYTPSDVFPPISCTKSNSKPPSDLPKEYPTAKGSYSCSEIVRLDEGVSYDGKGYRYDRGAGARPADCTSQEAGNDEHLFELSDGASLKNVIVGRENNDAIYCKGACTIENVWWEEVCEDALTLKGKDDGRVATITGGGARAGTDKTFQHNAGGTLIVKDFDYWFTKVDKGKGPVDGYGKFFRSCGGCSGYTRHIEAENIRVHGDAYGEALVGINAYNGDTAKLKNIQMDKATFNSTLWNDKVCKKWNAKSSSVAKTYGPDGEACIYSKSDIKYVSLP